MMALAESEFNQFPDVQVILDQHGVTPDAGEDQGIPLMQHAQVANLGENGIPAAVLIEEEVGDRMDGMLFNYIIFSPALNSCELSADIHLEGGYFEEELVELTAAQGAGQEQALDRTIIEEDLPIVVLTDSEDEQLDELY